MIDFSIAKPEEVIRQEYLKNYQELHKDIYNRLVHVRTSLIIIDTIRKYPLDMLYGPGEGIFWNMIYWNFLYSTIVLLHGLIIDEFSEALTLPRLRNLLAKDWIQRDIVPDFYERLRDVKFDEEVSQIKAKIRSMRHHIVAHRLFDTTKMLPLNVTGVSFHELKKINKESEDLFKCCSFGMEYLTSLYWPRIEKPDPTADDVEEIIELLLKNSSWINSPEKQGPFWEGIKEHIDKKDIEEMNRWRQKFGMSIA